MAENAVANQATGVTIGALKETAAGETRVSLIPDSVKHLVGKGLNVVIESGAGEGSSISDEEYRSQGATVVDSAADVIAAADVVTHVAVPTEAEIAALKSGQVFVSFMAPLFRHELNTAAAEAGVTAMAVDAVPRTTRAQSMDALSAMASIGGYKAVLLAASHLPKFFPLLMTAAGTIRPARVLVIGAGVAGLQAIATARRLGAVVDAYDTRAVVKEQVESLGANFVVIDTGAEGAGTGGYAREATPEELRKQQEGLNEYISRADVVITTAAVPGRPAPKLIPADAVANMRHGSVIVDLAAETGGNCDLTQKGEIITEHGVTIIGLLNLPATLPVHASQMYAKVITNFLDLLIKDGQINLDLSDEILAGMTITHGGQIIQEATRKAMSLEDIPAVETSEVTEETDLHEGIRDEEPSEEIALNNANLESASEAIDESMDVDADVSADAVVDDLKHDLDNAGDVVLSDVDPLYDEENVDVEAMMSEPAEVDDVIADAVDEGVIDEAETYVTEIDESALTDTTADGATAVVQKETDNE